MLEERQRVGKQRKRGVLEERQRVGKQRKRRVLEEREGEETHREKSPVARVASYRHSVPQTKSALSRL